MTGHSQASLATVLMLTTEVMQQSGRQQRRLILQKPHMLLSLLWPGASRNRA